MKTIEVTDEMHGFLMELSKELNTQSHRSTAMPYFFQIQTKKKVAVPEGNGTEVWHYDGSTLETDEEITEAIAEYKGLEIEDVTNDEYDREQILEDIGYRKFYQDEIEEYENAFLTEKACKEHIRLNDYHYNQPVDYLSHSFRNPELEKVMEFLCGLSGGEIHK